ncbi:hypothetical protein Tco_0491733 [Tanacetum coccineum]
MDTSESSAPKWSTMIHFRLPERRSTCLTPPTLVATVDKADEMILQATLQISLTEHKSREEQEAREICGNGQQALGKSFDTLADHLQEVMVESLPTMVDMHIKEQVKKQVPEERGNIQAGISSQIQNAIDNHIPSQVDASIKFERLQVKQTTCRTSVVHPRDQDDPHDDAHPEGRIVQSDRRHLKANECIVSITESDYKNLNKNDIEDMYLLIMNGKVPEYAETGLLWSLSVFIRISVIWEIHKMFSIVYEPMHRIIYKNSKKEKRMMRHSEIHKFCDATLIRVLKGLKSYNNDIKYGYVQRELTNDEAWYLKLFEEEIEVRLKYLNHMRRREMYVNGRHFGPEGTPQEYRPLWGDC